MARSDCDVAHVDEWHLCRGHHGGSGGVVGPQQITPTPQRVVGAQCARRVATGIDVCRTGETVRLEGANRVRGTGAQYGAPDWAESERMLEHAKAADATTWLTEYREWIKENPITTDILEDMS